MIKGVYTRPRFAWSIDRAAGSGAFQAGTTGQFKHFSLFNDDSQGATLNVYGIFAWTDATNVPFWINWAQGAVGTFYQHGNMLNPQAPQISGSTYTLGQATEAGTNIMDALGQSGQYWIWAEEPLFRLPPGYSLIVIPNATGRALTASFIWAKD